MHDCDIREVLRTDFLKDYMNDESTQVVEEFVLPVLSSRIDIAILNGSFIGIEIKSEKDTLKRLYTQIQAYQNIFDYLIIITQGKHLEKIVATVPNWIGIKYIDHEANLVEVRKPRKNKNLNGFYLAQILRKQELFTVLDNFNIKYSKKTTNWKLCEMIAKEVPITTLSKIVLNEVKLRYC